MRRTSPPDFCLGSIRCMVSRPARSLPPEAHELLGAVLVMSFDRVDDDARVPPHEPVTSNTRSVKPGGMKKPGGGWIGSGPKIACWVNWMWETRPKPASSWCAMKTPPAKRPDGFANGEKQRPRGSMIGS